jgi:hypothetical protein
MCQKCTKATRDRVKEESQCKRQRLEAELKIPLAIENVKMTGEGAGTVIGDQVIGTAMMGVRMLHATVTFASAELTALLAGTSTKGIEKSISIRVGEACVVDCKVTTGRCNCGKNRPLVEHHPTVTQLLQEHSTVVQSTVRDRPARMQLYLEAYHIELPDEQVNLLTEFYDDEDLGSCYVRHDVSDDQPIRDLQINIHLACRIVSQLQVDVGQALWQSARTGTEGDLTLQTWDGDLRQSRVLLCSVFPHLKKLIEANPGGDSSKYSMKSFDKSLVLEFIRLGLTGQPPNALNWSAETLASAFALAEDWLSGPDANSPRLKLYDVFESAVLDAMRIRKDPIEDKFKIWTTLDRISRPIAHDRPLLRQYVVDQFKTCGITIEEEEEDIIKPAVASAASSSKSSDETMGL